MVREPQLDNSAPWKQRFRAPIIARARIARLAPTRGLVMSNRSGIYQLYTCLPANSGNLRIVLKACYTESFLPMDVMSIVLQIPRAMRLVTLFGYLSMSTG